MNEVTKTAISAIRALAIDGIQAANSGHPGLPLGAAPMAYELMTNHMVHSPKNPQFFNRDRFILSAGHGSMLQYSLLHLLGYDISIDDLRSFRQLDSITTGHPEYGVAPGVEVSTGPLGQGMANAVGFAIAETMLAHRFNRRRLNIVDHYTYVLCGDGCMMEGIEYEAASLAGTLKLGKLIALYDSNDITIEGNTSVAFSEDVAARHAAQGWQVLRVENGEDIEAIGAAIEQAKADKEHPSLIVVRTTIGYGSPKAGSASCHGSPLGAEGVALTKHNLGYEYGAFEVPQKVRDHYAEIQRKLAGYEEEWNEKLGFYKDAYPNLHRDFMAAIQGKLPKFVRSHMYDFDDKPLSTRKASSIILNRLADELQNLVGGSADLGPSNLTVMNGKGDYSAEDRGGRNMHFGIREHAMAAIVNGMYLHGGVLPYCSTFFVFSDYMKGAMRMSALMKLPVIYILTHDSIGVGEDGPTHQPIEQLTSLRAMPGIHVFRPADGKETAAAYMSALDSKCPTAIVASRQDLPALEGSGDKALRGGYIISDCYKAKPDVILIATGSEVALAIKAKEELMYKNIEARVVSMPCMELFLEQDEKYRNKVLPPRIKNRVAIEAGSSMSWGKLVGLGGGYVCMDTFGSSAPNKQLFERYGFTVEHIVEVAEEVAKRK